MKKISPLELHAAILVYITSTTIYSNVTQQRLQNNAWLGAIEGYVVGLIYVYIFISLTSKFQNKTIIEINDIIYGKYIGKIITGIYLYLFIEQLLDALLWSSFFIHQGIMPDLSRILTVILIIVVSLFSIKNGIIPILRYAILLAFMTFTILIITYLLLSGIIDFSNLLPIEVSLMEVLKANIIDIDYTYGELIYLFFIIFPNTGNISDVLYKKKKYVYLTLTIGGIYSLFVYIRNSAILGNLSFMFRYSSLQVVRYLGIGEVFSRLEILFFIEYLGMIFYSFCIIYYSLIYTVSQLSNIKRYNLLGILIGIALIIGTYYLIENISMTELNDYYDKEYIYTIPGIRLGLPIITIMIFHLKKIFAKNEKNEA